MNERNLRALMASEKWIAAGSDTKSIFQVARYAIVLLASLLPLIASPAHAEDARLGKLLYETHCTTCHYESLHNRPTGRSLVKSRSELQSQVIFRATLTSRQFTSTEIEDIVEYLNSSHYKFTDPAKTGAG